MAFVTSAGTLDKRDETTRQMLADKADFIGAIRLPGGKNGAFKDNAGTEVTTDIIFLKKHEGKSLAEMSDIPDWVHIGETADGLPINKYFEQHPDMVLGTVVEGNKLYGSGTMVVAEDGFDLKSALHEAVGKLSTEISHEHGRDVYAKTADGVQVQIPSNLRNYSFSCLTIKFSSRKITLPASSVSIGEQHSTSVSRHLLNFVTSPVS